MEPLHDDVMGNVSIRPLKGEVMAYVPQQHLQLLQLSKVDFVYSHKRVVDESPLPRSLQHVVQAVLQPAVARVPAAALRAVRQRLP